MLLVENINTYGFIHTKIRAKSAQSLNDEYIKLFRYKITKEAIFFFYFFNTPKYIFKKKILT